MFTYKIRPRVFQIEGATSLPFPAQGIVRFHMWPGQPFGTESRGGHTGIKNVGARVHFNANTGEHDIESQQPLSPLEVTVEEPGRNVRLMGRTLTVAQHFEDMRELTAIVWNVYFAIPLLLSLDFADPPIIERVDGEIAGVPFRWELAGWKGLFMTTTQERQSQFAVRAWSRIDVLSQEGHRRLVAATHYFYVAQRLARRGQIAGEFMAEMLLNLCKALEALFPSCDPATTIDAVRSGLRQLGFSEQEIEADYIPAMALRSNIDVAHIGLAQYSGDDLQVIHAYTEHAEFAFRILFERLFTQIENGTFKVAGYDARSAKGTAAKTIERMRNYMERYTGPRQQLLTCA